MSIKVERLFHIYDYKGQNPFVALKNINLNFNEHFFSAIVGETGSGKSTLIQHFNGLLKPTFGEVQVNDFILNNSKKKNKKIKMLKKEVGIVFQFPEYQLFEETVEKDVAVGPKNFGFSENEAIKKAHECLSKVGLDETYYKRSPFDLSGGERRRVAIAGILALSPSILVLDEPTAGLDVKGEEEIMNLFMNMYQEGTSIILVTHDMDLVLKYAQNVIALNHGEVIFEGKPVDLFSKLDETMAIEVPPIYQLAKKLNEQGFTLDMHNIHDAKSFVREVEKNLAHEH